MPLFWPAFVMPMAMGLFEDQAGKLDWYRQQIGMTRHALFQSAGQQRLALVATESGVIAGIDLRNGQISWRQVLPDGETVTSLFQHGRGLVSVSVSMAGAHVRLWGSMGGLLWDAHIPRLRANVGSPSPSFAIMGNNIVVSWQSNVHAFYGATGEVVWRVERDATQHVAIVQPKVVNAQVSSEATISSGSMPPPPPPLHAFSVAEVTGELEHTVYEQVSTGSHTEVKVRTSTSLSSIGAKPDGQSAMLTLDGSQLVMVDVSGTRLMVHDVGGHTISVLPIPSLPSGETVTLERLQLPRVVLLRLSLGGSLLVELPPSAKSQTHRHSALRLVRSERGPIGRHLYAATVSREGQAVLAFLSVTVGPGGGSSGSSSQPDSRSLHFEVLQIDAEGWRSEWSGVEVLPYDADAYGSLQAAWLNTYSRKDGTFGHRLLLSSADHSLQLLQTGKEAKVGWMRPEALASVLHAEPVPLPALIANDESGAGASARSSFGFVLPVLVDGLKQRVEQFNAGPLSASTDLLSAPPLHADPYGFRQAVVVTTAASKVFALHTSDGSVLWSRRIPPLQEGDEPPKLTFLLICRAGAHPQVIVVAQGASAWALHFLSPTSGKWLPAPALAGNGRILHAMRLTALAATFGMSQLPVLLLDDQMRVYLYPDTDETRQGVRSLVGDLFFYLHTASSGVLTGYALVSAPGGHGFQVVRRWALALPPEGPGQRVHLADFSSDAAVHSPVRVLGDRTVLHKYVNRNLLAVGIEHPGDGDFEDGSLLVMLVDTVSGRIVHSVTHPGMRGPLALLLGENWLVWHFWNPKALIYQMAVVELFTNSTNADDPVSLMLGGAPDYAVRENGFDAFAQAQPHVLSQSYAFAAPIQALAVTQTVQGITPKFVLVATTAGQLLLLDKRFLDPRRPHVPGGPAKMSVADKEEGLIPYGPSLGGISPLSVATHRHTIARPRTIIAAPTNLESTSLAFVIGLDLFMSRVAPAREFDRLNEDFNYMALILAIMGLAVGTYVSGCLSDRKDLKRAWK